MAVAAAATSFLASGATWVTPSFDQVKWLLGIAAANFLGQLLLNRGFQRSGAASGAAINTQQVLYSYIWGLTILQQPLQLCAAAGSCSILAGVVAVSQESSYSKSMSELARARSVMALEHRLHAGRLSFIDRLLGREGIKYKALDDDDAIEVAGDALVVVEDGSGRNAAAGAVVGVGGVGGGSGGDGGSGASCHGLEEGLEEPLMRLGRHDSIEGGHS